MKRWLRVVGEIAAPPLVLLGLLLVAWEFGAVWAEVPPYILPRPTAIALALRRDAVALLHAMGYTLRVALGGFVLSLAAGACVSFAFAQSAWVRRCGYPYAILLQTVPIVAIAQPILTIFGSSQTSVMLIAAIISVFPIITNVTSGLLAVERPLEDLFALYRATRWQRLTKLQLPTAVPYLVAGAKVASGLTIVGSIVGEFFAGYGQASHGLGYLILLHSGDANRTDRLFAAVLAAAVLGMLIFGAVNLAAALLLRRWTRT